MAIKLFGKTIHTPPAKEEVLVWHREASGEDDEKTELKKKDNHESIVSDESMSGEPNFSAANEEKNNQHTLKANGSIDKQHRKPPIILPCPRCKSTDTKFCYFNNYKVNQPRHFCKQCQRYWTAGGSIRNVPIGAGRRKSKSFAVNRHNRVPDCALDVLRDSSCLLKPDGTLLSFGSEAPICQSMASVLDLVERKMVITKSDCYGLHPCLSGGNRPKPCSHIPPQSNPSKIQWLLF